MVRVVSLSTTEITEITRFKLQKRSLGYRYLKPHLHDKDNFTPLFSQLFDEIDFMDPELGDSLLGITNENY